MYHYLVDWISVTCTKDFIYVTAQRCYMALTEINCIW